MFEIDIERIKGNRFWEIIWRRPCPQKILMVADSSLNFGSGGFGLSEFVSIIQGAGHTVSTAHRNGSGPVTITGNYNFATSTPALNTSNFDQIWLFGFSTAPLAANEQARIAQFMRSGGGVFATGDHDTIGSGMGSNIPRVRSLRNWSSIPMATEYRHDTVIDAGPDNVKQFNDQADAIAQRIYPVFFSNGGPTNVASSWNVHPVVRHSSGAVDFLPDHPHESECWAGRPNSGSFAGVEEWPAPAAGGARFGGQVVAISISAGRFITDIPKPPVRPRCFGAISAYDGDPANVGRIVCDATWHHFVNINLNGAGGGIDPATGNPRTGLYIGGVATSEYQKIKAYFTNTVRWLAPRNRRICWPFVIASTIRFDFEMLELRLPFPHPCPWDDLIRIGSIAEDISNRLFGPGAVAEMVDEILAAGKASPAFAESLRSLQFSADEKENVRTRLSLFPIADIRRAILGSVVNYIAVKLPDDEKKLEASIKKGHEKIALELISEGLLGAEKAVEQFIDESMKETTRLAKALKSRK